MSRSAGKQTSNQLATLTAHATQLQTRLLVALDTLDAQSLAHASELATLQESYDKLAARARRLEYERNAANDDLAEMTSVLELVVEKVSAANDYKVLAHSDIHLPTPLSPPRTRSVTSSSRSGNKSDTPTDSSAYTAALVSALNAQLDAARAQVARERADSERKIARLEAMVELRDVELKRNLSRSVNAPEGNSIANVSGEGVMSGSETGSRRSAGMSRGEAISAYENVARDNERLEKEVTRLKAALASAEFNRATSEIHTSSSWAQLPEWARPQPQSSQSAASNSRPKRPSSRNIQAHESRHVQSESSDRAPSSLSEPGPSPVFKPSLQREDSSASDPTPHRQGSSSSQPTRARSSASTSDPHRARSRTSRPTITVSDSNSDVSRERVTAPQSATSPSRRTGLRDSGIAADSGSEATRTVTFTGTGARAKSGTKDRDQPRRRASEANSPLDPTQPQSQEQLQHVQDSPTNPTPHGQDLMPLLPALTPSKIRAPRVEAIDLPSTSYIEPSFGVSLKKKARGSREDNRDSSTPGSRESSRSAAPNVLPSALLEPPKSAAIGPTPSPRAISPVAELLLPPSVVSREQDSQRPTSTSPVLPPPFVRSPSPFQVEPACAPNLELAPRQPPPILQPPPVLFQPSPVEHSSAQQGHRRQRSRSSSRTARLSPLPIFDLAGLPAYESLPGASSAPLTKTADMLAAPTDSPIRRQSDPSPTTQADPAPLVRQRSNSFAPSTPPRSTNNTAQFAFITPVHENIYGGGDGAQVSAAGATAGGITINDTQGANATNTASTAVEAGTTIGAGNMTTGRRRLLPLFKFMSPSPGTPPSTKKRRPTTAPSQFSSSTGPETVSPMQGIAASPLARGRPVRESPLQLVMGAAHASRRAEMRVPVMREVGSGTATGLAPGIISGGLVPPIVPNAPLNPLVAQLVPHTPMELPSLNFPPGTSSETQNVLRGMQVEQVLLDRAQTQQATTTEVTPEGMAHVLYIEAECLRLRRDSAETAALRQEVEMLRAQLREQTSRSMERDSLEQDYTTTTASTSRESDVISESVETYSEAGDSDDTAPTATEATLPETGIVTMDPPRRRLNVGQNIRSSRADLDAKDRSMAGLYTRTDDL